MPLTGVLRMIVGDRLKQQTERPSRWPKTDDTAILLMNSLSGRATPPEYKFIQQHTEQSLCSADNKSGVSLERSA